MSGGLAQGAQPREAPAVAPPPAAPGRRDDAPPPWRRGLAATGRFAKRRISFLCVLAAASWGVLREAVRPLSWRRTVRHEFRITMRQATIGGLATTFVTASLTGFAMVSQALYWLGVAGQAGLAGSLLVTVLVRELTPLLVGLILLGRSGMLTLTEFGMLKVGGQVRTMISQGIDPFLLLVLPRTLAMSLSGFTLGILFATVALVMGFIVSAALGTTQDSLWTFLDKVVSAMTVQDYMVIPAKLFAIGYLVGLSSCLTGLTAKPEDDLASLMPRGFVRGILVIMVTSILLTLAV
ncbi:MlaE family ABC transporter permease [Lichenicoccus sp.]|uniref:MlaE family ABC transporter permease n=1 Tax=Lichenicoccus sp. TaxID=2781899 RepID=UPI003D131CEE